MDIEGAITAKEAADILGVSLTRVRNLCERGQLRSTKFGHSWAIDPKSVQDRLENPPKVGPPFTKNKPKTDSDQPSAHE